MAMDGSYVEAMTKVAQDAGKVNVTRPDGERADHYWLTVAGETQLVKAQPPFIGAVLRDIPSLVNFIRNRRGDDSPAVWVNLDEGKIVALPDANEIRDRGTMELALSPAFEQLLTLADNPRLDQAGFIGILRTVWRDKYQPADLLKTLRKINFTQIQKAQQEAQHGKVSLGKEITAQLTGAGEFPEYLTIATTSLHVAGVTVGCNVECCLEVVPDKMQFVVQPLLEQVQAAKRAAEDAALIVVRETLASASLEDVPVYRGTP